MNAHLRDRRIGRGQSPGDLARELGVHPASVLRWERRERLPAPGHVRALARALGTDPTSVAAFFDEARPSPAPDRGHRGGGLRPLRRAAGVPVAALADVAQVPVHTVYNWEAGRVRVPDDRLPALARLLGIPPAELAALLRAAPVTPARQVRTPLARLRHRAGLSQTMVSARTGLSRHSVGLWERGAPPPLLALRRLASAYGVSVSAVARAAGVTPPALLDPRLWRPGTLPDVLATLRRWHGLTQREVAERSRCSAAAVRAWEAGRTLPRASSRAALEAAYGLRPGALLTAYPERVSRPAS